MRCATFVERLRATRATAILRTDIPDAARPAMDAAIRGGFRIIEFTLTTPNALELIAEYAKRDDVIVGAGTILSVEDAWEAAEAGAAFLVSPVIDDHMIAEAHAMDIAIMPGTHTPTEMLKAHRAGAPLQKLFPAPANGPTFVHSCLGPMPFLNIVPTNGVDETNAPAYLRAGAFAVGFTTSLFRPLDMADGRFYLIEERARKLLKAVSGTSKPTTHHGPRLSGIRVRKPGRSQLQPQG